MPPQGCHHLGVEDPLAELASWLRISCLHKGLVLLTGDFNARVGRLELPVCAMRAGAADSVVNVHGRQLY